MQAPPCLCFWQKGVTMPLKILLGLWAAVLVLALLTLWLMLHLPGGSFALLPLAALLLALALRGWR